MLDTFKNKAATLDDNNLIKLTIQFYFDDEMPQSCFLALCDICEERDLMLIVDQNIDKLEAA